MRWFAGVGRIKGGGGAGVPRPAGARAAWDGPDPLWLVGEWPDAEVRVHEQGHMRLAVLGDCHATESELRVGLAVARGGGLRHLTAWPGSYHVVLSLGRRTLVLGDLAGVRAVYWTTLRDGPEATVYASHALPLAALTGAGLDTDLFAARIVCPDVPELVSGRSLFSGISRVEQGHALELTPRGVHTPLYGVDTAPLDFPSAAWELRNALTASVDRRVSTAATPGVDLSGGRDSTVLTQLAARAATREVVAVTWADPGAVDDLRQAQYIASTSPRMRHVVVEGDDSTLPYADLGTAFGAVPVTDDPGAHLVTAARTLRQLGAARDAGVDVHIAGYGGDAALGTPLTYLADLALDRRRVLAARHARSWARITGMRPGELAAAARRTARTPFSQALSDLALQIEEPTPEVLGASVGTVLGWCAPAPAAAWASRDARHRLAASLRRLSGEVAGSTAGPAVAGGPAVRTRPGDRAAWVEVLRAAERQRVVLQLADHAGVRLRTPYLDSTVVRAALALPAWARDRGDGPRALLETAVDGLVPREFLVAASKGDYTSAEQRGLRRYAHELMEMFEAPLLAEIGLIDASAVRGALARAAAGPDGGVILSKDGGLAAGGPAALPLGALAEVVSAELWLRQVVVGHMPAWEREGAEAGEPFRDAARSRAREQLDVQLTSSLA